MAKIRIGVDLMGSDQPPQAIFEAVLQVSQEIDPSYTLVVFAQDSIYPDLKNQYTSFEKATPSIEFVTSKEVIMMDESPLYAVRRKRDSTMSAGMRMLKEQKLDAFVSTGNTGALIATAMHYLPMLPEIDRPALLVVLPTEKGSVAVLDVGAGVSSKPEHLVGYAVLGILYRRYMHGLESPKVGLLNVGVEEQKGTKLLKETYRLLKECFRDQFLGNIEGVEAFQGKVDVLITDGFTGNVFLKTSEGVSRFLMGYLQQHFPSPELLYPLQQQFNYSEYPGGFLIGVDGVVVKCHGYSDARALMNGIHGAVDLAEKQVLKKIHSKLTASK